jgi:hypothetical protein
MCFCWACYFAASTETFAKNFTEFYRTPQHLWILVAVASKMVASQAAVVKSLLLRLARLRLPEATRSDPFRAPLASGYPGPVFILLFDRDPVADRLFLTCSHLEYYHKRFDNTDTGLGGVGDSPCQRAAWIALFDREISCGIIYAWDHCYLPLGMLAMPLVLRSYYRD